MIEPMIALVIIGLLIAAVPLIAACIISGQISREEEGEDKE